MATYYWRGNTGNWTDFKWSTNSLTPAGNGTLPPPSASDDAVFDGLSGTGTTITVDTASTITNINFTGYDANSILSLNANLTVTSNFDLGLSPNANLKVESVNSARTIFIGGNISGRGGGRGFINNNGLLETNIRFNGSTDQFISNGGFWFSGANITTGRLVIQFDKSAGILDQTTNTLPTFFNCKLQYISGPKTKAILGFTTAATTFTSCIFDLQDLPLATINFTGTNTLLSNFICRDLSILNTGVSINNHGSAPNAEFKIDKDLTITGGGVSLLGNTNVVFSNTSTLYTNGTILGTTYDSIFKCVNTGAGTINVNININKTASKKLTFGDSTTNSTVIFGNTNNQIIKYTSGIIDTITNDSNIIINTATNTKFLDLNNYSINKITVNLAASATQTLSLTSTLNVVNFIINPHSSSNSSVNFTGSKGFTVTNFTADASSISSGTFTINLTSKSDPNSADNNYVVNGLLTLKGKSATSRLVLKGSLSVTDANADVSTGTPGSLNNFTGGVPEYRVSQTSGRLPIGLNFGTNTTTSAFLAKINSGGGITWILDKNVTTAVTTRSMTIGLPAYLKLDSTTGSYDINYISVFDIDSSQSGGKTILANNSYQNVIGIPNPNMFRTVNWGPLNSLIGVTVAYVE